MLSLRNRITRFCIPSKNTKYINFSKLAEFLNEGSTVSTRDPIFNEMMKIKAINNLYRDSDTSNWERHEPDDGTDGFISYLESVTLRANSFKFKVGSTMYEAYPFTRGFIVVKINDYPYALYIDKRMLNVSNKT